MKKIIIIFVLAVLSFQTNGFAQLKKLPPKKAKQIEGWLNDYQTFIELDTETRDQVFHLYERRFLQKDSIHNTPGLSKEEKQRKKKGIDNQTNSALARVLTKDEYLYIKCHHLTIYRLKQIGFITELGTVQKQRLMMAMREMRYKNMILLDQYGNKNAAAKEQMKQNREHCSNVEQQVFSEEMYKHLYKMNLLTVVDWSNNKQKEDISEAILEGYNVLDPLESVN